MERGEHDHRRDQHGAAEGALTANPDSTNPDPLACTGGAGALRHFQSAYQALPRNPACSCEPGRDRRCAPQADLAAFDVDLTEDALADIDRVYKRFRDPTTKPIDD